jgi:hypothetical protein
MDPPKLVENDTCPVSAELPLAPEGYSWILIPRREVTAGRGMLMRKHQLHFVLRMNRHPVYKTFQYRPGDLYWIPRYMDGTIVKEMLPLVPINHCWEVFDDETVVLVKKLPMIVSFTGQTMYGQDTSCWSCFGEVASQCCDGNFGGISHWACEACATKFSKGLQCPVPGCTNSFRECNFVN